MGSTGRCAGWQRALFLFFARRIYRGPFRFSETDAQIFAFAADAAACAGTARLDAIDFRACFRRPVGEIRRALGVSPARLRALYAIEQCRWP